MQDRERERASSERRIGDGIDGGKKRRKLPICKPDKPSDAEREHDVLHREPGDVGGDQWYDINTTIQTANSRVRQPAWSPDGVTYNLYGSSDESYGPLNFLYTSKPATSAALITEVTLGTGRNNFSGWVGGSITTASGGMQVTELGRYVVAGNTETHIVKLVNASTGQDVTGGSVTVNLAGGQAGTFAYSQLSSPVTLSPNTAYYLVSQEVQGGDQWYDFNTTIQTTGVASETTSVWSPDGVTYNLMVPPTKCMSR